MKLLRVPARLRLVPRAESDARVRAEALIADAEDHARRIVLAAEASADALRERARLEGEREGSARAAALFTAAAAESARASTRDTAAIAELAVEVARTILGRESAAGGDVVRDVARRALARLRRARKVVLRVHPDDLALARGACRDWLPAGASPESLDAEPDESVERGGVVVETDIGRLDARLSTQLEAIARALAAGGDDDEKDSA